MADLCLCSFFLGGERQTAAFDLFKAPGEREFNMIKNPESSCDLQWSHTKEKEEVIQLPPNIWGGLRATKEEILSNQMQSCGSCT